MAQADHLPQLTSLRFFAALAVMLHHSAGFFPGYGGVGFFFVLSGYLLATRYDHVDNLGRFYARRAARIWPLHLLTLAAAAPLAAGTNGLVSNALLVQAWSDDPAIYFGFNAPAWSLSVEVACYAAFPLLVGRVGMRAAFAMIAFVATLALASSGMDEVTTRGMFYVNPALRLAEFMAGMALAQAGSRMVWPEWPAILVLTLTLAAVCWVGQLTPITAGLAFVPASLLAIYTFARPVGPIGRALASWWLVRLGKASFALYLTGQLVQRYAHEVMGQGAMVNLGAIVVAVPIALAVHRWIEEPIFAAIARQPTRNGRVQQATSAT